MVRPPALTDPGKLGQGVAPAREAGTPEQATPPGDEHCPACGAAMASDQEWCLECGVARTTIQSPPDWRLGVAIVLGVVAIVVLVTVIAWP